MSIYKEPEEWMRQSIDSILNQTLSDFEFIIVNDNPDGNAQKSILAEYKEKDSRIIIIKNPRNLGLTKSLNVAIQVSKGRYIVRMDADDISMPNRLQVQYDFMESHKEVDMCGCWAKLFGDIPKIANRNNCHPIEYAEIRLYALFYNPMVHPSIMMRKCRFNFKIYNECFEKAQDYVLVGEALLANKVLVNIPQFLIKYRETKKLNEKKYREQQKFSSDFIRRELIYKEFPEFVDEKIFLHNAISSIAECDIPHAEQYLIEIKHKLLKKYSSLTGFINQLIQFVWSNICLRNKIAYVEFRNSKLYNRFSLLIFLRFIKRGQIFNSSNIKTK